VDTPGRRSGPSRTTPDAADPSRSTLPRARPAALPRAPTLSAARRVPARGKPGTRRDRLLAVTAE
jgi:hypothetical protein